MNRPKIEPLAQPLAPGLSRRNFFGSVASGAAEAAILTLPVEAARAAVGPAEQALVGQPLDAATAEAAAAAAVKAAVPLRENGYKVPLVP